MARYKQVLIREINKLAPNINDLLKSVNAYHAARGSTETPLPIWFVHTSAQPFLRLGTVTEEKNRVIVEELQKLCAGAGFTIQHGERGWGISWDDVTKDKLPKLQRAIAAPMKASKDAARSVILRSEAKKLAQTIDDSVKRNASSHDAQNAFLAQVLARSSTLNGGGMAAEEDNAGKLARLIDHAVNAATKTEEEKGTFIGYLYQASETLAAYARQSQGLHTSGSSAAHRMAFDALFTSPPPERSGRQ